MSAKRNGASLFQMEPFRPTARRKLRFNDVNIDVVTRGGAPGAGSVFPPAAVIPYRTG